jgi:prolyl-tRNA editing enzyme YbaK/EbsC (Cys-tRNA(Pro) deacylase)
MRPKLYTDEGSMTEGQLTPADLQEYITRRKIQARLIPDMGHTPTVPAAAAALGVEPDQIVKSLLFLLEIDRADRLPPQPLLVLSHGERRIDKRVLAEQFGLSNKRVTLAPAAVVLATLGYPAGGVPPFGHRTAVAAVIDASILDLRTRDNGRIFAGGGDDYTMLELTVEELLRALPEARTVQFKVKGS